MAGRAAAQGRLSGALRLTAVSVLLAAVAVSCSQGSSSGKGCGPGQHRSGSACAPAAGSSGSGTGSSTAGSPAGGASSGASAGSAAASSPGSVTAEFSGSFEVTQQNPCTYCLQVTESYRWDEKVTIAVPPCAVSPAGTSGCSRSPSDRSSSPSDVTGTPTLTISGTATETTDPVRTPPDIAAGLNCTATASPAPVPGGAPIRVDFALHQIQVAVVPPGSVTQWTPSTCGARAGSSGAPFVPPWQFEPVAQLSTALPYTKTYAINGGSATFSITGNAQGCTAPSGAAQPPGSAAAIPDRSRPDRAVFTAVTKADDGAGPGSIRTVASGGSNACPSITWDNDPAQASHDIGDGQETVSVGQQIHLTATLNGQPVGDTHQVEWTLPGPVAQNYVESPGSAQVVPVPTTRQGKVAFFWISAGTGSDAVGAARTTTETVQVTVDGHPAITHFTVKSPGWTLGPGAMCAAGLDFKNPHLATVGTTRTFVPLPAFGLGGNDMPPTCSPGINWSASVEATPGKMGVTQLILDQMSQNGTPCPLPDTGTGYAADTSDFYARGSAPGRLDSNDSPVFSLVGKSGVYKWLFVAQDYLMFQPAVPDSVWVPLARLDWRWTATVRNTGPNQWALDAATPSAPSPPVTASNWYREPEWSWMRSGDKNNGAPC